MLTKLITWIEQSLSVDAENTTSPSLDRVSAVLYVELLRADHVIDEAELTTLAEVLTSQFALSAQEVADLVDDARQRAEESADIVQYTRIINDQCDASQKGQLIENLWRLAYADNRLDGHEEYFIRKVADLIYVSHSDFIRSKLKVQPQ
ncbi:TerB family tellurite resistance protein [Alteromonadaceae bacterium BrNp21-10]|nr:TerB family tellurite resistance protein [Alteromonadaceae bacterium BrNp21-10]